MTPEGYLGVYWGYTGCRGFGVGFVGIWAWGSEIEIRIRAHGV